MAAFSDYLENELIKHLFRTGTFTKPTELWVALYTTDPTDADTGTEVSGGAYARVQLDPSDANWAATSGTDGVTSNAAAITFPAPSGANWGTITHFGIRDASTGGNLLIHGTVTPNKVVNDGDPAPNYAIGDLIVTLA